MKRREMISPSDGSMSRKFEYCRPMYMYSITLTHFPHSPRHITSSEPAAIV
jgi:hypothetical protein